MVSVIIGDFLTFCPMIRKYSFQKRDGSKSLNSHKYILCYKYTRSPARDPYTFSFLFFYMLFSLIPGLSINTISKHFRETGDWYRFLYTPSTYWENGIRNQKLSIFLQIIHLFTFHPAQKRSLGSLAVVAALGTAA